MARDRRRWFFRHVARNTLLPMPLRLRAAATALTLRSPLGSERRAAMLAYAFPSRRLPGPTGAAKNAPIWIFWGQGEEVAPPVVRRAIDSVRQYSGGREVIVLDQHKARDFVDFRPAFSQQMSWTHFADVLRLLLLAKHGGTWFDATCLQVAPMPPTLLDADFACFLRNDDRRLASWFLHAAPGHPILVAWLDSLERYWLDPQHPRAYYHLHYIFEGLITLNPQLNEAFERALPRLRHYPGMPGSNDPPKPNALQRLQNRSWLYKMSHKKRPVSGSLFEAIVTGSITTPAEPGTAKLP